MSRFEVIKYLDIGHAGPVALHNDNNLQEVHLYQGSIDGACGPYCLFMGLLALGLVDRYELINLHDLGRKKSAGKLLHQLSKYDGFFREGMDEYELKNHIESSYKSKLEVIKHNGTGVDTKRFLEQNISKDIPVILWVKNNKMNHWILAVGLKYDNDNNITGYLALDPGEQALPRTAWNTVVESFAHPGRYPYRYLSNKSDPDEKVAIAIALGLRKK